MTEKYHPHHTVMFEKYRNKNVSLNVDVPEEDLLTNLRKSSK